MGQVFNIYTNMSEESRNINLQQERKAIEVKGLHFFS